MLITHARIAIATLLALIVSSCREADPQITGPNVILIVVDSLRADYLGTHGFAGDVSPAIDQLASESIVYENAVAPSPWTKPSVASLLTGLDPLTHRVVDHNDMFWSSVDASHKADALPEQAYTLTEALRDHGYETAAWVTNPWLNRASLGFTQGFDHFWSESGNADEVFQHVEQWLETRNTSRPAFLYLHLMDVHGPYQSTAELLAEFGASASLGKDRRLTSAEHKAIGYLGSKSPWR
ncbi:MAG: sulfatase-like hydrolase/transferase, partial [bacterium]|nr:sulfatase-like hydrolase/transferase [bacterium]